MVLVITCDKDWRDFAAHYLNMQDTFSVQSRTNPTGCLFDINDGSCNHSLTKTTSQTLPFHSKLQLANSTLYLQLHTGKGWLVTYSTTCILPRMLIFRSFQQNALPNVDSLNKAVAGRSHLTATVRGWLFSYNKYFCFTFVKYTYSLPFAFTAYFILLHKPVQEATNKF